MNDAAHFLFIIGTLSTVLIAVLIIRAMLPKLFNWFRKTAFPIPKVVLSTITVALLAVFVVSKDFLPNSFNSPLQSPYVTLYSPSSATLNALTNALSPEQYRAGFALTSVTNITHDFTAPTNAVFCDLGSGVHDEAFWIPLAFNPEGTATNSRWGRAVCVAPSGMVLLDDVPDRLAPSLPDLSGAVTNRILSVLQTPSGLLPPNAGLWHTPTTNGSFLITWQKVFLGRQTNAVADLQLELFESGDFIYRLRLDENGDATSVTNWLIAAQDNGGGEVFAFAEDIPLPQLESDPFSLVAATNLIPSGISLSPQTLELRWTSFGELDPNLSDNDGDDLTDWDELFVHHTDPGVADTDADGLWDGEEVNQYGTSPVNADSNGDGDLDFWQFFSPSSFTNAPWAGESETGALLTLTTRLENSSASGDLAVLRMGDYLVPVLPDATLFARVSVLKGGKIPFVLVPGPGLSDSTISVILAIEGSSLFVFDDPGDVFETPESSYLSYASSSGATAQISSSSSGTDAKSRPTGIAFNIAYSIAPETICPHTGNGVLHFTNIINPRNIFFGFVIDEQRDLLSKTYTIDDAMLGKSVEDQPGCHRADFGFRIKAEQEYNGKQVSDSRSLPAHYCVPALSENQYPECQSNNPAYNPYAVPMPKNAEGNYLGTETRESETLIFGGTPDYVPVDIGSYAGRCPICGCEYASGSGHSTNGTASVYRETNGLKVAPRSLTTNGCFTVNALEPSTDYGSDVFTYQIGSWYNRGRYTVLGLSNYLAYAGGPVTNAPYSRVAVGVTNALVFWTGVGLPTGTLNVSLQGAGKAKLVVFNRDTGEYDEIIAPPATNYTSTITDWRNTYCNPDTLRVQAYLVPEENGLCTLTQRFEGFGNDIDISHSASQIFSIHTFLAEPITSETDAEGYVYNPSGIPLGGTSKFKVSLDPMTGFSENDIVWDGEGVSFVGDDNRGSEVTVVGSSVGSYMLIVGVNGLPLIPGPYFFGKVMTPTTSKATVWIVRNTAGTFTPITVGEISPIIAGANKILKQKALTLQWDGTTVNYTNRTEWLDITDVMNPTNAVLNALLNCTNNTGGLEVYFVNTLKDGVEDMGGLNGNTGLALAKGNEYGTGYSGHVVAHESLHQCGLYDIYATMTNKTPLVVTGALSHTRLPNDWSGGYYPKDLTQADLVKRLVMYGVEGDPASSNPGLDLPSGRVYGLRYTDSAIMTTNIWSLGGALVGQSDISSDTPEHQ